MKNVPDNPYPNERDLTEYAVTRVQSWRIIAAFAFLIVTAPLTWVIWQTAQGGFTKSFPYRLLSWAPARGPLLDHLHSSEKSLESVPYAKWLQQQTQWLLTRFGGEGSRKSYVGNDGWLYYQPELAALTGYGPRRREPFSPMKDPSVGKLRTARECVLEYAAQLKERGVKLMMVPIPVKATLYPEPITGAQTSGRRSAVTYHEEMEGAGEAPLFHPEEALLHDEFRHAGIDVVDVVPAMLQLRERKKQVYLQQDTHWTFDTMQLIAKALADHIRKEHPSLAAKEPTDMVSPRAFEGSSYGDLVKLLGLGDQQSLFTEEQQTLVALPEMVSDPKSEVVLMGDSFVNIYDDPGLGFAPPGSTAKLASGFAQHLALYLGRSLDVIAINGGGATDVRRELARRPDDEVRAKKLVVWVFSARDLLLSPGPGRDAGVNWKKVEFNPQSNPPQPIEPLLREP